MVYEARPWTAYRRTWRVRSDCGRYARASKVQGHYRNKQRERAGDELGRMWPAETRGACGALMEARVPAVAFGPWQEGGVRRRWIRTGDIGRVRIGVHARHRGLGHGHHVHGCTPRRGKRGREGARRLGMEIQRVGRKLGHVRHRAGIGGGVRRRCHSRRLVRRAVRRAGRIRPELGVPCPRNGGHVCV